MQSTPKGQIKDAAQKGTFKLECESTGNIQDLRKAELYTGTAVITNRGKASSAPLPTGTAGRPELQPWHTSIAWKQDSVFCGDKTT